MPCDRYEASGNKRKVRLDCNSTVDTGEMHYENYRKTKEQAHIAILVRGRKVVFVPFTPAGMTHV